MGSSGGSSGRRLESAKWWAAWDGNPLRRRSDRFEALCVLILLGLFTMVAPVAAWHSGENSFRDGVRTEQEQRAQRFRVRAALTAEPRTTTTAIEPVSVLRVPARWTAPDGSRRTGLVPMTDNAGTGDRIWIWTDRAGRPISPPQDRGQTMASAVMAATTVTCGLAGGVLVLRVLLRRAMDRRRLADWESAWRRTEPLWSGRRRGHT